MMTTNKLGRGIGVMLALPVALALGACEANPAGSGGARVRLMLTDAPGDLASAEVQIREIYLQGGNGEGGGRFELYSANETFDLLQLRDGVAAELGNVFVPAGTYNQLRVRIGEVTLTTEAGATYSTAAGTVLCPSCAQSGLKIRLPGGALRLEEGENTLIVDFDVAQSFGKPRGQSGRWVMTPTIAATRAELAGTIVGTVTLADGVTLPSCGGAQVTLARFVPTASEGEVSLSGVTNAEGALRFAVVAAGTYDMGYRDEIVFANGDRLAFVATPSVEVVDVVTGGSATVNYTVTAATCEVAPPAP